MIKIDEAIGAVAGVFSLLGYVPYIISILNGKTRPERASWIIWSVVGGLLAFSFMASGDKHAIWVPLGYFIGPTIVAVMTFFYGYSSWGRLDTVCVAAAILSLVPWLFSKNPSLTLMINVFIDASGAVPTLIKSFREPDTEDFTAWVIFFIANTVELFAIRQWNIAAIYPIYLFCLAGSIVAFILLDKIKKCFPHS